MRRKRNCSPALGDRTDCIPSGSRRDDAGPVVVPQVDGVEWALLELAGTIELSKSIHCYPTEIRACWTLVANPGAFSQSGKPLVGVEPRPIANKHDPIRTSLSKGIEP